MRPSLALLCLATVVVLGGCEVVDSLRRDASATADRSVQVVNESGRALYVAAYDPASLALLRIADVVSLEPGAAGVVPSGESRPLPFDGFNEAFAAGDAVVFWVYAATGAEAGGKAEYRLATRLERSYEALAADSFRLVVGDLAYEHLFGDPYQVLTRAEGDAPGVADPVLDGDTLRATIGFGGCSEGTFTLSADVSGETAQLAIYFDYPVPEGQADCKRYNYRPVALAVPAEAVQKPGIVLLNPNTGADPYRDAFRLR